MYVAHACCRGYACCQCTLPVLVALVGDVGGVAQVGGRCGRVRGLETARWCIERKGCME